MFWSDKLAQQIIESGKYKPYLVDDMFTPSGFAHIGSLRGPLVHDLVFRSLKDSGVEAHSTYVFNDFDCIDGLPPELLPKFESYLGYPLRTAPSPEPGFNNFAEYFISDFSRVLIQLGVRAEFLSSYDMYKEGKFNDAIRIALEHSEIIQNIYQKVSGSQKREKNWLPLQVVCEKCGKLGTTRVHDWDGKTVAYTCEESLVTWAKGCGYTGRIDPFDGRGKLPWKVDWPAHWSVLGVTIEGAGKDHSSAGGSRDIARELCKDVFHIADPFNIPYEFFLIGGKKMSSSKGLGLKARNITEIFPPEIARFLFTRTDYRQAIEINPVDTMAIPDLFDEYDRCFQSYISDGDVNLSRAFELAQIKEVPVKEKVYIPRFRDVANFIQLKNINIEKAFEEKKGSVLTPFEKQILQERATYAKVWVERYAPTAYRMQMMGAIPVEAKSISNAQKEYLRSILPIIESSDDAETIQSKLYEKAKELSIPTQEAFAAIYLIFMGKKFGPKAAWFLSQYPKDEVIKRIEQILASEYGGEKEKSVHVIQKPDFFAIDDAVKRKFQNISIGIARIKGVHIQKQNPELEKEKAELLTKISGLTNEDIGKYPEIQSYRKLYRDMKIDWHSRRPSPEALLRRIALGKGLYTVNTCVDAYNLVVMEHRISVGAFDADKVEFPTVLRLATKDDEILLLGDKEATKYTEQELAYYDGKGGYNIDFNYRDAQRTMVTEQTTNIWINVDGINDISQEQVERSLKKTIEAIQKYCGGVVDFYGIVI